MTCIVGLEHAGKVWLAGAAAFSTDNEVWIQADPKVFRRGDVLIGVCGEARFESVMRYLVDVPRITRGVDLGRWVNVDLAAEIRKACVNDGRVIESGAFTLGECSAMVGVQGSLFVIEHDLCGWRPSCGYCAIGSGAGPARTSLRETEDRKLQPKTRLRRALERAAAETTGVRPPFTFEVL